MIVGKLMVVLGLDSTGFNTGINSATGKTTLFAKATDKTFKAIKAAAKIGMLAVSAAFVKGSIDAAKFEKALANVSTMLDKKTMPMMKDFKTGILALSKSYGESTDALAKGLYDILSASIPASKALDVLETSAMAAKAGLTDTGVAADAITTLINSFGDATKDAEYYSDILFSTVRYGKTTFDELAPQIGNIAKLFETAGGTAEEMASMLSIMTRNGINTKVSITSLKGVVSALLKPTQELTEFLGGVTVEADGFAAVMAKVGSLPPADLAELFPNIRALTGVVVAAKDMESEVAKITELMNTSSPTMDAYEKQTQTLAFVWDQFKATLKSVSIAIGDELLPTLKTMFADLTEWLSDNAGKIAAFASTLINDITNIVALLINMKELILGVGTAILSLMAATKIIQGLNVVFKLLNLTMLGNPYIALTAGVIALGVAIFALTKNVRQEKREREALNRKQDDGIDLTEKETLRLAELELARLRNIKAMQIQTKNIAIQTGQSQSSIDMMDKAIERTQTQIMENIAMVRGLGQARQRYQEVEETVKDLTDATDGLNTSLDDTVDTAEGTTGAFEEAGEVWIDGKTWVKELNEELIALNKIPPIEIGPTEESIEKNKFSFDTFKEYVKENAIDLMNTVVDTFSSVMTSFMDYLGSVAEEEISAIEEQYEALTTEEIAYQDFLDKQAADKKKADADALTQLYKDLAAETDAVKKAEIEKQIATAETEAEEERLAEEAAAARVAAEETSAAEILVVEQELAKKQKKIKKALAVIDMLSAVIGFMANPSGWAGVALSAMALITGAATIAAIEAEPIPMIRGGVAGMIDGGVFDGNPGIDTNNVALTSGEYVMPPQQTLDNIDALEDMRAGAGQTINISPMPLIVTVDGREIFDSTIEFFTDESDKGSYRLNPKVMAANI